MKYTLFIATALLFLTSFKADSRLSSNIETRVLSTFDARLSSNEFSRLSSNIGKGLSSKIVRTNDELYQALSSAEPGDEIIMANRNWEDIQIRITVSGTEKKPITLRAETPGQVKIQGLSSLEIGGDYIVIDGLHFTNGFSPLRSVIHFAVDDQVANHCTVTNCAITDYNKLQRNFQDLWILLKGRNNQLDHCYLAGKSNRGPTVRVDLAGNENINNYHKIINNHFGPRPPKGGPSAETIQIGNSHTSMCPSYTMVANNLFDECNGEVEVISSKTNFNEFRNNVFYKSEGSLVTRHGNYCTVDGNYFIGDETQNKVGGVRLIGTGHVVTNNYFYNLRGQDFRSPLAVMNGIPKSPLNRYIQVTDVIIAYNSWINCTAPLQFGVGSNVSQKDVLPASEIRSARPIRTVVANNLIYNTTGDKTPIVAHDELDGILFKSNLINNQGLAFDNVEGVKNMDFELKTLQEYFMVPTASFPEEECYKGFGFDQFDKDLFGKSRADNNAIGAITGAPGSTPPILDRSNYGTDWYKGSSMDKESTTHIVANSASLEEAFAQANEGDIIKIENGNYVLENSLKIKKTLTVEANAAEPNVNLTYIGAENTALFAMHPKGKLTLRNVSLSGDKSQYAFASLKENMSSLYNLKVENCLIENFDYILKAYKYSFSENIEFIATALKNCNNGIELSEETDDKGEYNAENIIIKECLFDGIDNNVIDYYRGGYDESTVGGNLLVKNCAFMNCGSKEKNGILINTYGIINVDISNNSFKNNEVEKVALLWGAKNNIHANNHISNSGTIVVEENLKLKTFY